MVNVLIHKSQRTGRILSLDLKRNEIVTGTGIRYYSLVLTLQFLEPGNERIHLELDTEDQDAGEDLNVVDEDDDSEILDEILIGDIDNNSQYTSPIHRQGNSSGKRGIKTPQKKALRNLFAESLESGIAPRKAEILKAQKTLRWPPKYNNKYTIIKNFVCNNMKKRKGVGRTVRKKSVKRLKNFVQESEDEND